MKPRLLIIIGIVFALGFTGMAFASHEPEPPLTTNQLDEMCRNGQALCQPIITLGPNILTPIVESEDIGGGSIDLDPDLSPSYAYDFIFRWNSIFVFLPLVLGIIAIILLSIHFILKKKNIPTRKYMLIIGAGVLLLFGASSVQNGIWSLLTVDNLKDESNLISLIGGLITISFGMVFIIPAIILLRRAKLRIRK